MTHPPEPMSDLQIRPLCCPRCGGWVETARPPNDGWRCDHCRITWTPDGTGGEQT